MSKSYYEDEQPIKHTPFYLEQKLINNITSGHLENALMDLKEINKNEKAVLADDPLRSAKNSIICSCTFFARAAINAGVSPEIAFTMSDQYIRRLELLETTAKVLAFEYEILTGYIKLVQTLLDNKYSNVVVLTMQFINSNLKKELSLNSIAEKVYVHPNYLSTVFKKETGKNVITFINEQRIKESSFYVARTDKSIPAIAYLYKFCNQSYYIKLFKEHYGVTPIQYRKSLDVQSSALLQEIEMS